MHTHTTGSATVPGQQYATARVLFLQEHGIISHGATKGSNVSPTKITEEVGVSPANHAGLWEENNSKQRKKDPLTLPSLKFHNGILLPFHNYVLVSSRWQPLPF